MNVFSFPGGCFCAAVVLCPCARNAHYQQFVYVMVHIIKIVLLNHTLDNKRQH